MAAHDALRATLGAFAALLLVATVASSDPVAARVETARRELARARAAHPGDHRAVADAFAELGDRLLAARAIGEAEAPIRSAYDMRRRLHGEDHPAVASSLHQLGRLAHDQRDYPRSLAHHQRALEIRRRAFGRDHVEVANSLEWTAGEYSILSDWGRCEALLREVLAIRRRVSPNDAPAIAGTLTQLGNNLRWQNELAEAEEVLLEAVSVLRRRSDLGGDLAEAMESLAMLHRFKEEHDKAEPLLQEVVAIRTRLLGPRSFTTLVGLANLALNHAYQGRRVESNREFESLRAIVGSAPAGTDLRRLGEILDAYQVGAAEHARDWPEVERYCRASVVAFERNPHDAELSNTGRRLGQARAAQGDLVGAERELVRSAEAYERARLKMGPGTKMATFKKTPYEQLALVRLERGMPAEAWAALEGARARVLVDQLATRRDERSGAGSSSAGPPSLSRVQASLAHDQAIVAWLDGELYPGALRSWACVVRKSGAVRWVRLPATGDLGTLSARFVGIRERMERRATSSPWVTDPAWTSEAHALWNARVAPLERHLGGVKELVVVASWAMGSFPVEMLLDRQGRALGERYAVVHAPSATVHALLRERARPGAASPRAALLVGDPVFRAGGASAAGEGSVTVATLRDALRGDARTIESLPRLKHSRAEVEAVAKLLQRPRILLGGEATEAKVASLAGSGEMSRCRVVHIATHALIDSERPQRSGLVLSRPQVAASDDGSGPDGIITGTEILDSWRLDADLVTLSACQTAVGRTIFGEGVVGLSYPILGAGARSLLVSQWKVDDEATALLMKRFYQNWLGKAARPWAPRMNKAGALREARIWLRNYRDPRGERPFAHPFYWAAFVLVGDPD